MYREEYGGCGFRFLSVKVKKSRFATYLAEHIIDYQPTEKTFGDLVIIDYLFTMVNSLFLLLFLSHRY